VLDSHLLTFQVPVSIDEDKLERLPETSEEVDNLEDEDELVEVNDA
jgi:hypothetical protein